MKHFKISILFLLIILNTNCTRQKSKIEVKICNQTFYKITDISLIYSKYTVNTTSLFPDKCTRLRLENIFSESGLKIKYLQDKKSITHEINIYFEEFSYEGLINIIINNQNIDVTNNITIKP